MADIISEEARRLIDEALAEGRVTRIPMGVRSATNLDFSYNAETGRLRYSDPKKAKEHLRAANRWCRKVYNTMRGKLDE